MSLGSPPPRFAPPPRQNPFSSLFYVSKYFPKSSCILSFSRIPNSPTDSPLQHMAMISFRWRTDALPPNRSDIDKVPYFNAALDRHWADGGTTTVDLGPTRCRRDFNFQKLAGVKSVEFSTRLDSMFFFGVQVKLKITRPVVSAYSRIFPHFFGIVSAYFFTLISAQNRRDFARLRFFLAVLMRPRCIFRVIYLYLVSSPLTV